MSDPVALVAEIEMLLAKQAGHDDSRFVMLICEPGKGRRRDMTKVMLVSNLADPELAAQVLRSGLGIVETQEPDLHRINPRWPQ
jgi:hypothetical protein